LYSDKPPQIISVEVMNANLNIKYVLIGQEREHTLVFPSATSIC
jgi:hypothetical protein